MKLGLFGGLAKSVLFKRVVLPLLLIYCYAGIDQVKLAKGIAAYAALIVFLRLLAKQFRSQRRKHGSPTDKLNVLLVGDAFPPKVS